MSNSVGSTGGKGLSGLTRNESLVLDTLSSGGDPLKAYEILDRLKGKGVRAPMTVYRALDGLEKKGLVHKLEGQNSFLPCNHNGPHSIRAFLVCGRCPKVAEVDLDHVEVEIMNATQGAGFDMHTTHLEVKGVCKECADA